MNDQVVVGYLSAGNPELGFIVALDALRGNPDNHIVGTIAISSGPKVDKGRNQLFQTWLEETSADYFLMLDDDMVPPPDTAARLMRHRKDIVGALVFAESLSGNVRPVIHVAEEGPDGRAVMRVLYKYPTNTLIPVDGTGGACMLVTRRCAREVKEAMGDHAMPWFAHGLHNNLEIGEDIAFCMRAAKLGFQTWVDTGLEVPHIKKHTVGEVQYVRALMSESHPYYDLRAEVPIYQELTNGDGSNPDRPSDQRVQDQEQS